MTDSRRSAKESHGFNRGRNWPRCRQTVVRYDNYIVMEKPNRFTTIGAKCSFDYRAKVEKKAINMSVERQKKISQTQLLKRQSRLPSVFRMRI